MKRTYIALLLVAVLLMGLSLHAAAKETILWWYESATPDNEMAMVNNLIRPFNEAQDAYELVVRYDPNVDANVRIAMLAGSGPDLVMTAGVSYVQQYVQDGYLLPLDDYADKYGWYDRFPQVMIDLGSFDGKLYSLPKTYESMILFYNKTLFEANGWEPPQTKEDLDFLIAEMTAQGIIPFAAGNASWRGNNEHHVGVFLNHYAGPDMVYKALLGEIPWTAPEFVEAIEMLNEFYQAGYYGTDYYALENEDFVSMMAMGQAGMSIIGTWGFQWMNEYFGMTGQDWDWAPLPSLREGVPYPLYDLGIGTTLSINAESASQDGVAEVINFLTGNKDVMVSMNRDWPGEWNVPVTILDAEDFGPEVDHRYARHIEDVANATDLGNYGYTTWTFWPQKTAQYIVEGIELVWLGEITPAEYMAVIDELFQEEFNEGVVPPIPER